VIDLNERRPELFDAANRACKDLRKFIAGELDLNPIQIEVRRALIRTASKKSLYFFAKAVLSFSKMTESTHGRWSSDLQSKWLEVDFFGRLKPRGTFKTSLYGEAFMLWVWATVSPEIRFFYTSANQSLLDEVSAHLNHYLAEDSDSLYAFVFGIKRDSSAQKNTQYQFNITGRDKASKGFSLTFRTVGGSTNGLHPHIIVVDDPCDQEDRESHAVREQKKRWFDSLYPLLVEFERPDLPPIKKIMLIGTRWHLDDVMAHVAAKDGWHIEVEGAYNADGSPRFPEILPKKKLDELSSQVSEVFFSCQYNNDPLPEGTKAFAKEKLLFVRPDQYDLKLGTNYCFFDPSKGKEGSDFPAAIWVNVLNGRRVVFHAVDEKVELTACLALIAKLNKQFNVRVMVWETNGTMGLEAAIYRAHKDVQHSMAFEDIHETRNKRERIYALQPELYSGQLAFRTDYETAYPNAMKQVLFYPAWANDDYADVTEKAVSYLVKNTAGPGERSASSSVKRPSSGTLAGSLRR
jgi:phage terminase large subunit-like protein